MLVVSSFFLGYDVCRNSVKWDRCFCSKATDFKGFDLFEHNEDFDFNYRDQNIAVKSTILLQRLIALCGALF
jgi:hypothetical protein